MPFKSKITPEEKKQLLLWAASGMGFTEIANRLENKISKQRVAQLCAKAKINVTAIQKREKLLEQEQKRKVKLGSFYRENPEEVDIEMFKLAYKKFKNKVNHSHWECDMEFADVEFSKECPILGLELDYHNPRLENSAQFDRIDSTKGYVKGNVWIISRRANRIKNDGTAEEHRLISNAMFQRGVK